MRIKDLKHQNTAMESRKSRSLRLSRIALGVLLMIYMSGCAGQSDSHLQYRSEKAAYNASPPGEYLIKAGDRLMVKFYYNPELNDELTVRPDGKISLQLIDDIDAAGLTPAQLDGRLTEKYSQELRQPKITIIVKSFTSQVVYVGGEVNNQGPINLISGMTPIHAVLNAGGFKATAKPDDILIIRKGNHDHPYPIRLNLDDVLYGKSEVAGFELQPYDVVYVPKTTIAKVNTFVDQYIKQLLLFNGWGFGVSYEVNKIN